jgi:hypothetical protein
MTFLIETAKTPIRTVTTLRWREQEDREDGRQTRPAAPEASLLAFVLE